MDEIYMVMEYAEQVGAPMPRVFTQSSKKTFGATSGLLFPLPSGGGSAGSLEHVGFGKSA